jgi:hypothetical protein
VLLASVCINQPTIPTHLLQHLCPFPLAPLIITIIITQEEKKKKQHHCPNCRKPLTLGLAVASSCLAVFIDLLCTSSVAENFAAMTVVVV